MDELNHIASKLRSIVFKKHTKAEILAMVKELHNDVTDEINIEKQAKFFHACSFIDDLIEDGYYTVDGIMKAVKNNYKGLK